MKYNREYLRNLCQFSLIEAKAKVKKDFGFDCHCYHAGVVISAIARPGVLLFHEDGFVKYASAGDPAQLEE